MNDKELFNNQALFNYIQAALNDSGGDGSVSVVLKQQRATDVAKEYGKWLTKNNSELERSEDSDTDYILFSDKCSEAVIFGEWKEYSKFIKGSGIIPFVRSDFLGCDTVIVTW